MLKKEKEILDNIIHKTKGKTTIIISHRISSFKNTNKIIVLENGKVKEIGDHKKINFRSRFLFTNVQITA